MRWFALALVLWLCACASPPATVTLASKVTRAELVGYAAKGGRTIAGQGFLRQMNGGVVTCAGDDVTLLPAIPVVDEAMSVWKSGEEIDPDSLAFADVPGSVRWVECDASGAFIFENLPSLTYWIVVPVRWRVPDRNSLTDDNQGGILAQKVSVEYQSQERLIIDGEDRLFAAKPWQLTGNLTKRAPPPI